MLKLFPRKDKDKIGDGIDRPDYFGKQINSSKLFLGKRSNNWVEESFINYSDEDLSEKKNYLGLGIDNKRLAIFLLIIFICCSILFLRSAYLQIVRGDYYLGIAEKNRIRNYNLPAPRGIIYDTNGIALVHNVPSFAVFLVPNDLKKTKENQEAVLAWLRPKLTWQEDDDKQLEKILNIRSNEKEYYEPVLFKDGLDNDTAMKLRIESVDHPGVVVDYIAKREYVNSFNNLSTISLSHILGYEGKISQEEYDQVQENGYLFNDFIGKTGIEKYFESQLRGLYGREVMEVDSVGRAVKIIAKDDLQKGNNIYLSLDANMQAKLESIIQNYLAKYNKSKAIGIILNPQNGEVLSMVNIPSFDNNDFAQGISSEEYSKLINDPNLPLFNRAISGEYPSGSTIKMAIGAAALQEGIVTEHSTFLSTGGIRIGEWFFPDWKAGGHGLTDIRNALAWSVNTFFYMVGGGRGDFIGLGVDRIKTYLEKFGFDKLTGIELPGERNGFLPSAEWKKETKNEIWYIGDTYHLSIGQGDILVTPLQIANYTAYFANSGKLNKVTIVDRIYDQAQKKEIKNEPVQISQDVVSPANTEIIRQGMRAAVQYGSARILLSLPVTSAAKTGTAEWQVGKEPHAWFTAFAPYNNSEIVVTILVEEGKEGSAITAAIANEFMNWYFRTYKKG